MLVLNCTNCQNLLVDGYSFVLHPSLLAFLPAKRSACKINRFLIHCLFYFFLCCLSKQTERFPAVSCFNLFFSISTFACKDREAEFSLFPSNFLLSSLTESMLTFSFLPFSRHKEAFLIERRELENAVMYYSFSLQCVQR